MCLSGLVQHVGQALIKCINNWRLIMYKLVLNVGDSVRNIKKGSSRYLLCGVVTFVGVNLYHVAYSNGVNQYYHKKTAHNFLEKIVNASHQCKAANDEVYDNGVRQMQKAVLHHHLL